MTDLAQIPTAELMRMRDSGEPDLSKLTTKQLMDMREPSASDRAGRVAGLGARAIVKGVSAFPALGADAISELVNAGAGAVGADYRMKKPSQALDEALTSAGLPQPQTPTERVSSATTSGMTGAGGIVKLAKGAAEYGVPAVRQFAEQFAKGPGVQVVSGGAGPGAGQIAQENGAGPAGQFGASLAASMAVPVTAVTGAAAVRGAVRGGESGRQQMADNIRTFKDAGADTVSAGQASGNRALQATESGLSRVPGGAAPMSRTAQKQADEMGAKVNEIADNLSPNATSTKAGITIENGLKSFVGRFKAEQNVLYGKLDQYIPPQTRVDVSNTKTALANLNADIPGAPNLSEWFKNSKIQGIEKALEADTSQQVPVTPSQLKNALPGVQRGQDLNANLDVGKLPYEALKKLRTLVGNQIEDTNLASDIPRSKWKALYGALSDDLSVAANQAGPQAEQAFNRANWFTRAGHTRIDTFLDRIGNKGTVEKIYQAAVNPSELREGASTINAVMRTLTPAERPTVQAAFIKRMGLATPGNQNELGDVFSSQTFLTNWNKISPEAKMTLFAGSKGNELRANLDKIAEASGMIKEGSKVFANPSGTAQAISNQATGYSLGAAALTGHYQAAGTVLGGIAAANLSARLLTNQNFVRWLAQTTEVNPAAVPAQLNSLIQTAQNEDKGTRREIGSYVRSVAEGLRQQKLQAIPQ